MINFIKLISVTIQLEKGKGKMGCQQIKLLESACCESPNLFKGKYRMKEVSL